jgi:Leucine-rich repeat (LRR) protein
MPSKLTVVFLSLLLAIPAVIFWLWLLIQPIREAIQCPEECRCDEEGFDVNCFSSGLNGIPSNLPKHVRTLVLDSNNITIFENDSFVSKGLFDVQKLQAGFCKITKIELGAFNGLTWLNHLSLESNDISEIIPGTFDMTSHLEHLDLKYNIIEHLESDVFRGLVKLQYIYLEGNKLQNLHPDTFLGIKSPQSLFLSKNSDLQIPTDHNFIISHSLKRLDISYCNILSVSVETFANVSALKWLDLSYNHLRSLDMNILNLLPELSVLKLRSNLIRKIIPGIFENFSRLEYLFLDYNKIEVLGNDTFSGLVNLKYIDFQGNKLQHLHPDTFVRLPNLQRLFLPMNFGLHIPTDSHFINSHSLKYLVISGCNVNLVSAETFANVSSLELLDLSCNNLRSMGINMFKVLPKLSALYVDGNPLHCDCQLQEVWRWCQDHNIQTVYGGNVPQCNTPNEVKGIWWGVLEKGRCLQDNIQYYGDYKNTSYSYTPIDDMDTNNKMDSDTETKQSEHVSNAGKQYKFPIAAIIFIFGTTGNVMLIIIITCNKDMRTVPNMYILNMAVSDVMYLMVLFLEAFRRAISVTWLSDEISCTFFGFCYQMSASLTAYSVAVLSIQRYRVTMDPLQFHISSQPTWRATGAVICGLWIVAALFTIPAARSQYLCRMSVSLWLTKYYQLYVIFHLLVSCVFPLCVIVFSYIMTARHLVKFFDPIFEETKIPQTNTRKITAKILFGLTVIIIISYVPFRVTETYFFYSINFHSPGTTFLNEVNWAYKLVDIAMILRLLLSINSCLNPIALLCTNLAFRRHFKRYLTCCCKTKYPPTDIELTRRN